MSQIRVAVAGAAGRMGTAVCAAVEEADGLILAGKADPSLNCALADVLPDADVVVDFTQPDQVVENALMTMNAGKHIVIGTSSFEIEKLSQAGPGKAFFAPNFAIGAVLMMRFAAEAAKHMSKAEIVELHHDQKLDAPSGTAAHTADLMASAIASSSGLKPPIHSVRLPGLVAHQEVILGSLGETLTIRHDSIDRTSFMPGVVLAVRKVAELPTSVTVGLDKLLFND